MESVFPVLLPDTIGSEYIVDKHNMILNTIQKEKGLNFAQTMNSEKTPHSLP